MSRLVTFIDRALYPSYGANWDDLMFRARILRYLTSEVKVLDLGAGAGIAEQMNFRGLAAKVCGIDLDPRVTCNTMLDEGRVSDAGSIPYGDNELDVVFADNVLEHLTEPVAVFREVSRVLKPGGRFLFKTPNKLHYVPSVARLTPHGFHQFVNKLRGRAVEDTFPTVYRANTEKDVARLAQISGLNIESIECVEGRPEYMRICAPLYLLGAAYERLVNSSNMFSRLRVILIGVLQKPTIL